MESLALLLLPVIGALAGPLPAPNPLFSQNSHVLAQQRSDLTRPDLTRPYYPALNPLLSDPNAVYSDPNSVYSDPNSVYSDPNSVYSDPNFPGQNPLLSNQDPLYPDLSSLYLDPYSDRDVQYAVDPYPARDVQYADDTPLLEDESLLVRSLLAERLSPRLSDYAAEELDEPDLASWYEALGLAEDERRLSDDYEEGALDRLWLPAVDKKAGKVESEALVRQVNELRSQARASTPQPSAITPPTTTSTTTTTTTTTTNRPTDRTAVIAPKKGVIKPPAGIKPPVSRQSTENQSSAEWAAAAASLPQQLRAAAGERSRAAGAGDQLSQQLAAAAADQQDQTTTPQGTPYETIKRFLVMEDALRRLSRSSTKKAKRFVAPADPYTQQLEALRNLRA